MLEPAIAWGPVVVLEEPIIGSVAGIRDHFTLPELTLNPVFFLSFSAHVSGSMSCRIKAGFNDADADAGVFLAVLAISPFARTKLRGVHLNFGTPPFLTGPVLMPPRCAVQIQASVDADFTYRLAVSGTAFE